MQRLHWISLVAALAALPSASVWAQAQAPAGAASTTLPATKATSPAAAPAVTAVDAAARPAPPSTSAATAPAAAGSVATPAPTAPIQPPGDPAARAVFERLRRISGQSAATGSAVSLSEALADFYAHRDYRPAWTDTNDVQQLLDHLRTIDQDGLDATDFRAQKITDDWNAMVKNPPSDSQRADFEVLASSAYISALVQLARGKTDPSTMHPNWNFDPSALDPQHGLDLLENGVDQHQVGDTFDRARPQNPLYTTLRESLAHLRQLAATAGWPSIADGPALTPGTRDARVLSLRQRLVAEGYLAPKQAKGSLYDNTVKTAVQSFQREQYLRPDGNVGQSTLAALNVPIAARIDQVRVNLERARWLLHELQGTFVIVDIAGFKVAYYRDSKRVWQSRVQVGKPFRSTPIFKSQITYVTFNPTWTVPPTILRNDILPKVRANPGYLAANRIRVLDSKGEPLSAASVNWNNPRGIILRQDAGPGNSLGQVVIRFPNPFSVYLHDTPHRELFERERRDTSSGCIRVEHPLDLVQLLFNDPAKWNQDTIGQRIATGKTQNVSLPKPVPILLAYWTVDVGDDGRVTFKPDVYGRDSELLQALNKPRVVPAL